MDDIETITLYDENGEELEFGVLGCSKMLMIMITQYYCLCLKEDDEQAYIFPYRYR